MYSIEFNLSAITHERGIKTNLLATEVTEHTEKNMFWLHAFSVIASGSAAISFSTRDSVDCRATARNDELKNSVCSVSSVAKNKVNRYSTQSSLSQYK